MLYSQDPDAVQQPSERVHIICDMALICGKGSRQVPHAGLGTGWTLSLHWSGQPGSGSLWPRQGSGQVTIRRVIHYPGKGVSHWVIQRRQGESTGTR